MKKMKEVDAHSDGRRWDKGLLKRVHRCGDLNGKKRASYKEWGSERHGREQQQAKGPVIETGCVVCQKQGRVTTVL